MKEVYTLADLRRWPEATAGLEWPLRLAVIGDPVAHSASPPMHNAALSALGLGLRYTRLHLRPEEVAEAFTLLPQQGFLGLNCTIPHKLTALALVPQTDPSARRAGGVNTVAVSPTGDLAGFSTDGPGFSRAVREAFDLSLGQVRIAILGAGGGAGRAVMMQCAEEGSPRLWLLNRTTDKLAPLVADVNREFPAAEIRTAGLTDEEIEAALADADLVVNCTAVGMKSDDPSPVAPGLLQKRHRVYDTIYTAARTPLMRAADTVGAPAENGLSMLLHQGARSFEIWFQREAPLEVMRAALQAVAPR